MVLPEGFALRPPVMADVEAVVGLINACALADYGSLEYSVAELKAEWEAPEFHPEADVRLLVAPDGEIVGFAEFWEMPDSKGQELRAYVYAHPEYVALGVRECLYAWIETRAAQVVPQADGAQRLRADAWSTNTAAKRTLEAAGYTLARHSWWMRIEMDAPPEAPEWPEGIAVRTFVLGQDEATVFDVRHEAYSDMWGFVPVPFAMWERFMIKSEANFDATLWFLATRGDEVVGMALCSPSTTEDPAMGWVSSVGVRRAWRRKGIASALLRHAFGEFYRRGTRKVGLSVDSESLTGAQRLYEQAGMSIVRQRDTYSKTLQRPAG